MQLTDIQTTTVTIQNAEDARGNPVPSSALGSITWSIDNPNVIVITPSSDTLSCACAAAGPISSATLTCKATLPSGEAISGTLAFTVVASAPVSLQLEGSAPTPS